MKTNSYLIINKVMIFLFTLYLILSVVIVKASDEIIKRTFKIPNHGNLLFEILQSWKTKIKQPPQNLPPTIIISPEKGDEFEILITALWSPQGDKKFNQLSQIKNLINNEARAMLSDAVEKELEIKEIRGTKSEGYYFFATDKAPKRGEYKYIIRAGIGVGNLLLSTTVLTRTKDEKAIRTFLLVLKSMEQKI